jgi:hypothetical protein
LVVVAVALVGVGNSAAGGVTVAIEPPAILGRFGIGAMSSAAHVDCNKFLIRPYSLESIDKFHRTFTAIQFPMYVQVYDCSGGSQLDGSLSLFD